MIEIELKKDWWLTSDRKNWILGKKVFNSRVGGDIIRGEYFFSSVESVAETLVEEYTREEDAKTLEELLQVVEKAKNEILKAIKNFKEQ